MTRTSQAPNGPNENRIRFTAAALSGILAGVARAITDWLLNHLGS